MSTTWTEQRRISGSGTFNGARMTTMQRCHDDDNEASWQWKWFLLSSYLLLPRPASSCSYLFLSAPVCSYLLVPPPTSSRFLPLSPVSPTSSCLLLPLPSGVRGAFWSLLRAFSKLFRGLLGASGGLFGGLVKPLAASWKLQGAFWGHVGVLGGLGELWGDLLGASRRPVGDLVGVPWGRLRGSWNLLGPLGASLGLLGASRERC